MTGLVWCTGPAELYHVSILKTVDDRALVLFYFFVEQSAVSVLVIEQKM
jgi:hypothetical protein